MALGEAPEEHSKIYQYAMERFDAGCNLDHDSMNVWNSLAYVMPAVPQSLDKAKPRRHYRDYTAEIDQSHGENGEYVEMIMQRSAPEAVSAFDALVDEFNADLDRIKLERDFEAIKRFVNKAKELVYSKK